MQDFNGVKRWTLKYNFFCAGVSRNSSLAAAVARSGREQMLQRRYKASRDERKSPETAGRRADGEQQINRLGCETKREDRSN